MIHTKNDSNNTFEKCRIFTLDRFQYIMHLNPQRIIFSEQRFIKADKQTISMEKGTIKHFTIIIFPSNEKFLKTL